MIGAPSRTEAPELNAIPFYALPKVAQPNPSGRFLDKVLLREHR
jgi:hypothetical protein